MCNKLPSPWSHQVFPRHLLPLPLVYSLLFLLSLLIIDCRVNWNKLSKITNYFKKNFGIFCIAKLMIKRKKLIAEINLVPYIDVMLVLLVIFMIVTPILTQGVHVQLPQAAAKALPPQPEVPIIVSVDSRGDYYLNTTDHPTQTISPNDLLTKVAALMQLAEQNHTHRAVYVKGDDAVDYGKVVQAMVLLQRAGVNNVGLMTQTPENISPKK